MPLYACKVPRGMIRWKPLLRTWGHLMDKWCSLDRKDVPYWYGERPLTGLLTAAAWSLRGGKALEESGAARGPLRQPRTGRIDSYIVLGRTWYQLEAKVKWPSKLGPAGLDYAVEYVDRALDAAEKQLESPTPEYHGDWELALCYVVPSLVWAGNLSRPQESSFLDDLRHRLNGRSILAVYKPPHSQQAWTMRPKRRYYPGVLLVGRVSRRPS